VPELASNFGEYLAPLSVEPVEVFVFQCDSAWRVVACGVRLEMVRKEFIPAES
jgi:hypothetical protein